MARLTVQELTESSLAASSIVSSQLLSCSLIMVLREGLQQLDNVAGGFEIRQLRGISGIQAMLPCGRFVSLEALRVLVNPTRDLRLQRVQSKGRSGGPLNAQDKGHFKRFYGAFMAVFYAYLH